MKRKTQTAVMLVTVASMGMVMYLLLRKRSEHKKWEQHRADVLLKAKKKGYGDFVL